MNYDEIMRNLEYTIKEHKDKFVGTFETNIYDMARDCKRYIEWQQKEIDALKPQPDSETGLMPCGCGGKVAIAKYPGFLDTPDLYQVDCFKCNVGTRPAVSPEIVRNDWNGAMGYTDAVQEP